MGRMADVLTTYRATLQSSAVANGNGTAVNVGGLASVVLEVSGLGTATITPQGVVVDATANWTNLPCVNVGTGAVIPPGAGITSNGKYLVPVAGFSQIQCPITSYSGGTINVTSCGTQFDPPAAIAYPQPPAAVTAGANVAASSNNQTLGGVSGKTTYLAGFAVTGLGATGAGSITITTTGLTNNLNFVLPIPSGATTGVTPLVVTFNPPLPASAQNTAISINIPSYVAGNTTASASAWGYQL